MACRSPERGACGGTHTGAQPGLRVCWRPRPGPTGSGGPCNTAIDRSRPTCGRSAVLAACFESAYTCILTPSLHAYLLALTPRPGVWRSMARSMPVDGCDTQGHACVCMCMSAVVKRAGCWVAGKLPCRRLGPGGCLPPRACCGAVRAPQVRLVPCAVSATPPVPSYTTCHAYTALSQP